MRITKSLEFTLVLTGRWESWTNALCLAAQSAIAAGDKAALGWVHHQDGTKAICEGNFSDARQSLEQALQIREELRDKAGAGVTRHNLKLVAPSDNSNVEALEVTRWLGCGNLRGHRCRGRSIEIPLVVAISGSSTAGNLNGPTTPLAARTSGSSDERNDAAISYGQRSFIPRRRQRTPGTAGNFNGRNGSTASDSSPVASDGHSAADSSESGNNTHFQRA